VYFNFKLTHYRHSMKGW